MWEMIGKDPDGTPIYRNNWGAYSPWIPVEERLPDYGQQVLVAHAANGAISVASREKIGAGRFWIDASDELNDPTHWMPLPEPPAV